MIRTRFARTIATAAVAGMLTAGAASIAMAEDIQKPGHGSVTLAGYGIGGKTGNGPISVELAGYGLGGKTEGSTHLTLTGYAIGGKSSQVNGSTHIVLAGYALGG